MEQTFTLAIKKGESLEKYKERLDTLEIVCLDIESTGLNPKKDEILQISIINNRGEILLNEYCKPKNIKHWDSSARVHGITEEMVKDCKPFEHYEDKVYNILNRADIVIGYNVSFDLGFIKHPDNLHAFDVMLPFARLYGEWDSYHGNYRWQKLVTCADYYNYEFNAHDSLEDVKATLYCFYRVMYNYSKEFIPVVNPKIDSSWDTLIPGYCYKREDEKYVQCSNREVKDFLARKYSNGNKIKDNIEKVKYSIKDVNGKYVIIIDNRQLNTPPLNSRQSAEEIINILQRDLNEIVDSPNKMTVF